MSTYIDRAVTFFLALFALGISVLIFQKSSPLFITDPFFSSQPATDRPDRFVKNEDGLWLYPNDPLSADAPRYWLDLSADEQRWLQEQYTEKGFYQLPADRLYLILLNREGTGIVWLISCFNSDGKCIKESREFSSPVHFSPRILDAEPTSIWVGIGGDIIGFQYIEMLGKWTKKDVL